MKKRKTIAPLSTFLLALLLVLSSLLFGCTGEVITENKVNSSEKEALAKRVIDLEATLQAEREKNYIIQTELESKVKDLEERLSLLTSGTEEDITVGNAMIFHYTVKDGKATVTKYEGTATLVEIPATLDGYPVTAIGERAFEGNTHLAAVIVPDGVITVDWFAFYGCSALFDITLPASVSTIGHAVFDGCAKPTITCPKDSYAAAYAKSYGISCVEK